MFSNNSRHSHGGISLNLDDVSDALKLAQQVLVRPRSGMRKPGTHPLLDALKFPQEGLSEDQEQSMKTTFEQLCHHVPHVHPSFCFSSCTGRKKAVCVGINYIGQRKALKGCINDAVHVREYLIKYHGFHPEDMFILTDDTHNPALMPTKKNILIAMKWLVKNAKKNDSLFFHYSGHGGQAPDPTHQEEDDMNEVIFPVDYQQNGEIIDDDMNRIMVQSLPPGCRLTALFDCCHSGTVLDLPFIHSSHGRLRKHGISSHWQKESQQGSPADVISFSACLDGQKSVDTFQGGVAVGAMSWAFIKVLKANHNITYSDLLKDIRHLLYSRYTQKPQIGSSHPINLKQKFIV